ncbi:MAG: hypothetical protein Q9M92_11710 [Enterobacterales bacterium]|nr:hypothetical protein [Enterobacterales bacterium]
MARSFKGRYKSVLVDENSYLLQLSRYIHRNPLEVKRKMVDKLEDYRWSSYPAYINQCSPPVWLVQDKTYQMLGHKQRFKGYRNYVEQGIDEDIKRFYSKGNILGVLGDKEYRAARKEESDETDIIALRAALQDRPSIEEIIKLIRSINSDEEIRVVNPQTWAAGSITESSFCDVCLPSLLPSNT